ncbi:MAG: HAD family phosphatase [Bacilli bacterium]|nr:HAD family phosphatase [Bacilli bacterium]
MIKLIATDLDGTLFYPKKKIRLLVNKNKKFLKRFIDEGNRVVLVSGRNFHIARRIIRKLKHNVDMIACNGSALYREKNIIEDYPMPHDKVLKMYLDNLNNRSIMSWIYMTDQDNMIIVPNKMGLFLTICYRIGLIFQFRYRGSYKFGKRHFLKMIKDENVRIYKAMSIYGLGQKGIKKASNSIGELQAKYGDIFEVVQSHSSLEIMNKNINKASCLLKYIKSLSISKEEVAVVGDSGNDVPLFEAFPNSFVMAQAQKEVMEKAKTVINGVFELEKYVD